MVTVNSIPVRGSTGNDVLFIQKQLLAKGFNPGSIDGIFAAKTAAAIVSLQKKNGLEGSGTIGPKTLALLDIQVVPSTPAQGAAITRPLANRKSARHLHPTLRILMEAKVFTGGIIPVPFINRDLQEAVELIANGLNALGIVEATGHNDGEKVSLIQAIIGPFRQGGNGDSWCESTVQCIIAFLEDYYQIESPVPASESVVQTYNGAHKIPGLTTPKCEEGTFFHGEHQNKKGTGHTGTVLKDLGGDVMKTFEGNRSNRAYIANRSKTKSGDLVNLGFVRAWPYNKIG